MIKTPFTSLAGPESDSQEGTSSLRDVSEAKSSTWFKRALVTFGTWQGQALPYLGYSKSTQ